MLHPAMPGIDDPEGAAVPAGLPPVIDAHVHLFPPTLFAAVWQWFDQHAWPIRYRLEARQVLQYLWSRGVAHVVALQYAHRPGLARELNRFLAAICAEQPGRVTGLATVFPGEDDAATILREAFALGLGGVKLHAHVQCFDMNSAAMTPIYEVCAEAGRPLLMHVGREPKSPAYRCDIDALCRADKLARVLQDHPTLQVCVPHLGFDETDAYAGLLERHDNLWLDTSVALADYLTPGQPVPLATLRGDRLLYGSDFPNIPYAWDRELNKIAALELPAAPLAELLAGNARRLYRIEPDPG